MLEELPHLILCAPGPLSVGLAVRACGRCQGGLLAWQALALGDAGARSGLWARWRMPSVRYYY